MKSYISRPILIQAAHFDGTQNSAEKIIDWANEYHQTIYPVIPDDPKMPMYLVCKTKEGEQKAFAGDYIVCGLLNEFAPMKPTVFNTRFQEVGK